jgi:5-methylcytosine-specific restriction protein A
LPQIQQRAAERSAQYKQRGTTTERGYGSDWKRASKEFLQRHPLCECDQCKLPFAIAVASNCVDHIKPIATHPHLRMVESNWRAMSIAHHNRHTSLTRNPRKGIDR